MSSAFVLGVFLVGLGIGAVLAMAAAACVVRGALRERGHEVAVLREQVLVARRAAADWRDLCEHKEQVNRQLNAELAGSTWRRKGATC